MKFGQKPTIRDMAKVVDDRLGRTTGVSKGKAPVAAKAFSPEQEMESRRMAPSVIEVSGERKL